MAKVDITVKNRVEGEKQVAGLGKTFQNTVDTIKTGSAAVLAAGATFKKAFDLAKEGANIVQLGESFDILNESVLHTPDLLEDMRAAVRGTVSDTDLMQGVLKLTAGASDDMARRFAEAAPQLLEISKAAGKLNPTLGDTAFLYDSISTGIKRQSPLILDNLGIVIKVGEANEKYAQEVGKAVEELTAEEKQIALLNATMESGNKLIEQAGGSTIAAGDAYARMEVMVSGLVNTFKTWLGEGLTPVLEVLTGSYSDAAANVVKRNQEMDVTVDVLTNRMLKLSDATDIWLGLGQKITGTEEEITQSIKDTVIAIAEMSGSTEEMADNLLAAGASRDYFFNRLTGQEEIMYTFANGVQFTSEQLDIYRERAEALNNVNETTRNNIVELTGVTGDVTDAFASWAGDVQITTENLDAVHAAALESAKAMQGNFSALEGMTEAQIKNTVQRNIGVMVAEAQAEADKEAAEAAAELAEKQRQLTAATGDYFTAAVTAEGAIGFYNESLAEMSDRTLYHSNLTDQQRADLESLQGAYNKTADEIRDYDLGIKGANLSDEERAEKIAALNETLGFYGAKMSEINSVGGEYVGVAGTMTVNQDTLNQAIYDAVDAQGASATELALLGGAMGLYSDEAVEAALKTALIQAEINRLAELYAEGSIDVNTMQGALQNFIAEIDNMPEVVTVKFKSDLSDWQVPSEFGAGQTEAAAPGGGNLPEHDKGGIIAGAFMQPQLIIGHGGEEVLRPDDPRHIRNGGGMAPQITVNVYPSPGMNVEQLADMASQRMAQQLRQYSSARR